ncbi:hypothetical protein [Nocardia brasiliensis]|uniref:hypothetical protein n=1 Tax=Nocardia brasiliensis TaxID=37326 RepID=UPI002455FAFE|nr:hypothetical protein [Nocardia brasiliensis]
MSTKNRAQWGAKIGRSVRPLPAARCLTDAKLFASQLKGIPKDARPVVVYRYSVNEMWRTFNGRTEVPTQLEFDWTSQEDQR